MSRRILLVEDHEDSRAALVRLLSGRGFEVIEAENYAAAVELGRTAEFELLLCDLSLPDGHGNDLIRELRSMKQFPAIAISGYCRPTDIQAALAAGFDEYLAKPFSWQDLEAKMRPHFKNAQN